MHNEYLEHLKERKQHLFGYPYNMDFSFSHYGYLLDYFINNLGDPYIPSNYELDSRQFEKEVVRYFEKLWDCHGFWGYITSSGTEGNLAALLYGKIALNNPLVYYSADTHYSVSKACLAYSLDSAVVPSTELGEMNYSELNKIVEQNRHRDALVICNLSTTFQGAYDSARKIRQIFELAGISRDHIFVHGDGALGGMILPFLCDVKEDYRLNGSEFFDSISVSGHKMIGVPIPCGVVLTKQVYVDKMAQEIEYLNSKDTTLNGSRNGLAAVLLYHTLTTTTEQEWKEKIQTCIRNAHYLYHALLQEGVFASLNDYSNTVVFRRPEAAVVQKWQLSCVGDKAHAVIMPHHNRQLIDRLIEQLVKYPL